VAEPRDTVRLLAIPRLMFLGLAIWAAWYGARRYNKPASGIAVVGGTAFTVEGCKKLPPAAGERLDVDLLSGDRRVLRVVDDEHGARLWLYPNGGGAAILVDRRDCSQWDAAFFAEGPDLFKAVGGYVTVTCVVNGQKLDTNVSFAHCGS
jgi:hypothetical protein